MNINISNPFFLHNQIILHNSRLSIDSKLLSKLINVPYPRLLKAIKILIKQDPHRKHDFIMVASTYHANRKGDDRPEYLITPKGIDTLARGQLRQVFSRQDQKQIQHHFKFRSYDQRIQD